MVVGCVGVFLEAPAAATATESIPTRNLSRIRMPPEFEELWFQNGVCRSTTFRSLVADLSRSDVIVVVHARDQPDSRLGGTIQFVTATHSARVLLVVINMKTVGTDRDGAIAMLAHELRHALEVAEARQVRTVETFNEFYRQHETGRGTSDTPAAREAGQNVRAELHRFPAMNCGVPPRAHVTEDVY